MGYMDLHIHTIYSDGTDPPQQGIIGSALRGLELVAIADHDSTFGYKEAKEEADKWGIKLLTGVEISTKNYHILGYNFDINDKKLQNLLELSRENQLDTTRKRIEIISSYGIPLTFDKVNNFYPHSSRLGKGNITLTMLKDKECREFFREKKNYFDISSMLYDKKEGLVKSVPGKRQIPPEQAIDAIHTAGGIAVLAHPFKDVKDVREIEVLREMGLDGLEIQPNFNSRNDWVKEYASKNNMLVTYGSDYHGAGFFRSLLEKGDNGTENIEHFLNKYKEVAV